MDAFYAMARYHEIAERIFAIFQRYTDVVEPLSIDEAFLDLTASTRLFGPVDAIKARFGPRAITRAALLDPGNPLSLDKEDSE
jgi:DNA polymerase IV